ATIALVATIISLALLLWRSGRLRGTTLVAPWCWTIAAVTAVGSVELLIAWWQSQAGESTPPAGPWPGLLRQAAAALTICPAAALLGAKRPQDRPWQFVVLSLWLVLCLPAAQSALFASRSTLLDTIWNCFLAILLLAGLFNHLGTRFWSAAICWFIAQVALLAPRLPGISRFDHEMLPLAGLVLLACSLIAVRCLPRPRVAAGWTRVWRDWRDAYGLLWGLRVAERFQATAKQQRGNVVLQWGGFTNGDPPRPTDEVPAPAARALRMLLRRFVPADWIESRLKE
ncbi:MAG: hypothetical protein WD030_08845, partial [Pirellulales bacterium]